MSFRLWLTSKALETGGGAVWRRRTYVAELSAWSDIVANAGLPSRIAASSADVQAFVEERFSFLNGKQFAAVASAFADRVSLITGGAGVGKTTTLSAIVDFARSRNLTVRLAAPTGKAAKRMEEVIGEPASTIHSLLEPIHISKAELTAEDIGTDADDVEKHRAEAREGMSFGFQRGRGNPIEADLVIVDEFSMVDVSLFASLIRALDFNRTSLLLVGDHNQLPSVGPGAILRDIVNAGGKGGFPPVAYLTEVMRSAGELRTNVAAILEGEIAPTSSAEKVEGRLLPWYINGQARTPIEVTAATIVNIFEKGLLDGRRVEIGGELRELDILRDVQVLTPIHKGPAGTIALNNALQVVVQRRLYGRPITPPANPNNRARPVVGDKVIWVRNDYELGVMNGTLGRVVEVEKETGAISILFDGKSEPTVVKGEKTDRVQLAYALTAHKAQGSEFPVAIVVCHGAHSFTLHRGWLYTAVSRARSSAILVGEPWAMKKAAERVVANNRRTMISALGPAALGALVEIDEKATTTATTTTNKEG